MTCKIINQTGVEQDALSGVITDFYPYAQKKLGFKGPVSVKLISDKENASDLLGKTAFYDPMEKMVALFVDGRHPKDILRSFSHELVHHLLNERGEFDNLGEVGEGYAQTNQHLRKMEEEAYLEGNLNLRDWTDGLQSKRKKNMKLNESTLKEMVLETLKEMLEQDMDLDNTMSASGGAPAVPDINNKMDEDLDNLEENEESEEKSDDKEVKNKKLADRDKDGKLSSWEKTVAKNIEKSMEDGKSKSEEKDEKVDEAHCGKRDDKDKKELDETNSTNTIQENVSNDQWYNNTLYETLKKKWVK